MLAIDERRRGCAEAMSDVKERPRTLIQMCVLAVAVGVIAGLGAWAFRMLIGVVHNAFFLGIYQWEYDTNQHTPLGPFGMGIILAPVIGSLAVTWLVQTFAPEARGHGVPEVMDAIHYGGGRIRPVVAAIKSLASAISIGSGGSVGREGPIIQIGSAFGSTLGQIFAIPQRQRITLIAAGAGAGIAATFNAPLGGVLFAVELLLVSINARTMLPVTLATVVASYIGRALLGDTPAFEFVPLTINDFHLTNPWMLTLFLPLGLVMGLAATLMVRSIYWFEDGFDMLPIGPYLRHMLGMLGVGVMIYLLMRTTGHYYVQGVGYATIMDVVRGVLTSPGLLLALLGLKLLATCLTLGSGGSGGVFSPALFTGACLGAACGHGCQMLLPDLKIDVVTFALAGMAAMVGASTGAVLTAVVMLQEMTYDNNVILPVLVTTIVAAAVRKLISPESIYTLKLIRRGHVVPDSLQMAFDEARRVRHVMSTNFGVRDLAAGGTTEAHSGTHEVTLLARDGYVQGVDCPGDVAGDAKDAPTPSGSARFVVVAPESGLNETLRSMRTAGAACALVTNSAVAVTQPDQLRVSDVLGVMTLHDVGQYRVSQADLYS